MHRTLRRLYNDDAHARRTDRAAKARLIRVTRNYFLAHKREREAYDALVAQLLNIVSDTLLRRI